MVESSLEHAMNGNTTTARKRRRSKNDIECRTAKAFHLTQVWELSSARDALESSPVAPGNEATKRILTDEARRPSKPRSELDPAIADLELEVPFDRRRGQVPAQFKDSQDRVCWRALQG